ncbi:GPI anchored CFEM domain-containing protein [Mytilinidion resinicola]|uniref:GPI anchored CFEM domain-containing protein n=1 Tax=Mytilinidion resinicola TaxID=574789 RepID=A0A6A6YZM9_9PEZI|nr:GPI anchored CFEM domain-containing protein [Mytilinidion resinicola]KAF2813375.1 GPI anchored CFEM domain-containing protein [Mytilinidion resinicola]
MKASFAAVAIALASVATAQLDNIPSCALSCFITVLTTDGCSGLTDFTCHCKKTDLIPKVTPCVQSSCSASDQAKVITAVEGTCAQAGVPLSLSAPGGGSSTPAASSTPVAASSSAAVYSSAESTPASSAVLTVETTIPASSAVATATSLVGTGTIITTPVANGTVSATASPSQFTGAAAQVTQAAGMMAAAAFALAAAL